MGGHTIAQRGGHSPQSGLSGTTAIGLLTRGPVVMWEAAWAAKPSPSDRPEGARSTMLPTYQEKPQQSLSEPVVFLFVRSSSELTEVTVHTGREAPGMRVNKHSRQQVQTIKNHRY